MVVIKAEGISLVHSISGIVRHVFSDVTFEVKKGEMLAVLGACGVGKSSLANALAGLTALSSGKLAVCGRDPAENTRETGKQLAILLQNGEEHFLSAYLDEELSYGPLSLGLSEAETAQRVQDALVFVGLWGYERRSPQLLTRFQRKRAALAAALSSGVDILLLDEPFSGLCRSERRQMADLICRLREKGKTIVLFTKEVDEAAMAERVLLLRAGQPSVFAATRDILGDAALLESAGLAPGFALRVFLDLKEAGISLENCPVSMEELVDEICR